MSVESTNKNIWACILYAFGFFNWFSSNVLFFLFYKYIRSQHVGNKNKQTKTCPFPMGSLRSPDERTVPLLQIVYVLPMKMFCCRHIILSLQRYDCFQDWCLIISRNSDMGLRFCTATSGRNCLIKIKNVPIRSHLPLLLSFLPQFVPSPQIWLSRTSIPFFPLTLPIHLHLFSFVFRKHSHRPSLASSFIFLDLTSLMVFKRGCLLQSLGDPLKQGPHP